jgi:mono/diheme cytochrome c family protein
LGGLIVSIPSAATGSESRDAEALFETKLRPLLAHRCAGCHGAGTVEGEFDISTREKLLAGGASGPAVVPGKATESLMYRLAARLEEPHMPEEGDALTAEELGWLAEWINAGAPFDRPLIDDSDWQSDAVRSLHGILLLFTDRTRVEIGGLRLRQSELETVEVA